MPTLLDEVLERLGALPDKERAALTDLVMKATPIWVPTVGPQLKALQSEADEIFFGGEAGGGKMLDLRTPVPTPSGWMTIGALAIGDRLFDETGAICRVTAVHSVDENPVSYRLRFDDGAQVDACADHLWLTFDAADLAALTRCDDDWRRRRREQRPSRAAGRKSEAFVRAIALRNSQREYELRARPTGSVRSTAEIAATLLTPRGRRNHAIPVSLPLSLPASLLPVPPYTLGAWLGDGNSRQASITCHDPEILAEIERDGYGISPRAEAGAFGIIGGLLTGLRDAGVLGNKHIPATYLRASSAQREALLQGLLDTDGTVCDGGQCEFTNTNRAIIDGVHEIIVSLGMKARIREGMAKLNGRVIGPKWMIKFSAPRPMFRLGRKRAAQRLATRRTTQLRYVVACDRIDPVAMRCITVDSPSRLYLVGRDMVPTHNTDLLAGLALTEHRRSLVLRRTNKEADKLVDRFAEILGSRVGWNSQEDVWRLGDGRIIDIGGCQHEDDKQKRKGTPHDFIGFDEVSDFTETQYTFIIGWNRSADEGQRCRVVAAGNPPTRPEGLWVIKRWAAWLDPTHPNPAKDGELRWYTTDGDREIEVDGPGPHMIGGRPVIAKSRTFIRSKLSDNPDLAKTNYGATLDALPPALRAAYREGRFDAALQDQDWQVIPTEWILAAEARWKSDGWAGLTMTAMALDPAGGGRDSAELSARYGGWYAPLESMKGPETADGSLTAAWVVSKRRNNCPIVVDVGGGYGGAVTLRFKDNAIPFLSYNGASEGPGKTKDGQLAFANKRALAYWRFREELDPDQEGGSAIALPPDSELRADLAAPTWRLTPRGIVIESKDDLRQRLGRSPGKGDAVVMALSEGSRAAERAMGKAGIINSEEHGLGRFAPGRLRPKVLLGHDAARRRR